MKFEIKFPEKESEDIRALATARNKSISALIREAMREKCEAELYGSNQVKLTNQRSNFC